MSGIAPSAHVELGIGDDAAVLAASGKRSVISVDAAFENVHFRRSFAALDVIAERALIAALSDLAAMGAAPRAALLALGLPDDTLDEDVDALAAGFARASEHHACPIVGGNLSRANELSITSTVVGETEAAPLTRSGARDGDSLFVTGVVGAAALGLLLLERDNDDPRGQPFVARFLKPVARIAEGLALRGQASAAIDVSDGLLQDLAHVCRASGVGAMVETMHLPLARGFVEMAHALGRDPLALALGGGDDYELLFTLPAGSRAPDFGTRIGTITARSGEVSAVDGSGKKLDLPAYGYRHFDHGP